MAFTPGQLLKKEELAVNMVVSGSREHGTGGCWGPVDKEFLITGIRKSANRPKEWIRISRVGANTRNNYGDCDCEDCNKLTFVRWHVEPSSQAQNNSSETSLMSDILSFFKNLTATEPEKLRLEHGLEQPLGTPTAKGLELSALISYRANLAEIDRVVAEAEKAKQKQDKA